MSHTTNLYSLRLTEAKSYLMATLFVAGNIILPQLCHCIEGGGKILLPIYFFTLIAAYKYGWRVGVMTAVMSPIINNLLFGMPPVALLPVILVKSSLLAIVAATAAHLTKRVSILIFAAVVLLYQTLGTLFEWAYLGDLTLALQDFRMGSAGMLLQVVGGWLTVRALRKG